MAAINAQAIKELRERTQAGMSDCKSALEEAGGDMEKAVEIILKKGLAKSAKRAGAVATEGEIRASVSADKRAATMVEVNIQTDFAARNDNFRAFVGEVLAAAEQAPEGADASALTVGGKAVADAAAELTARVGEKVAARRFARVSVPSGKHGLAHAYVHMGGKIGVLVLVETGSADAASHPDVAKFADDLAMHVAASAATIGLTRDAVSAEQVAKQKEIFEAQLREDPKPKPEAAWPKIIEGKLNKFYSEVVVLEQESVVVPGKTIEALRAEAAKAAGAPVAVTQYVRYQLGEGIEKAPAADFAAEVAKMAGA